MTIQSQKSRHRKENKNHIHLKQSLKTMEIKINGNKYISLYRPELSFQLPLSGMSIFPLIINIPTSAMHNVQFQYAQCACTVAVVNMCQ